MKIPKLKTERLVLEDITNANIEEFYRIFHKNSDIIKNMGFKPIKTLREAKKLHRYLIENQKIGESIYWGINYNNRLIGMEFFIHLNLKPKTWDLKNGMLGYLLDSEFRNKGFITEASKKIMEYGFMKLNLHKIKIGHVSGNIASKKVIKKLGFSYVGKEQKNFYWFNRYLDHYIYEMLYEDFIKKRKEKKED